MSLVSNFRNKTKTFDKKLNKTNECKSNLAMSHICNFRNKK